MNSPITPGALLEHADWVREIAARLVYDSADAEDVAQATLLHALEKPPREAANQRGWLTVVARNAARSLGRKNSGRSAREQSVAHAEALPSTEELLKRADLQRELVKHVTELAEPYRTVVLLRFFEGLPQGEIAIRTGHPVRTVETQLRRGLEQLRERLDGEYGSRSNWCLAFVPLLGSRGLPATPTGFVAIGGWTLALKLLAAIAIASLITLDLTQRSDGDVLPLTIRKTSLAADADELAIVVENTPPSTSVESASRRVEVEPTALVEQAAAEEETILCQLIDVYGRPLPNRRLDFDQANVARMHGSRLTLPGRVIDLNFDPSTATPGVIEFFLFRHMDVLQGKHSVDEARRALAGEKPGHSIQTTSGDGTFELRGLPSRASFIDSSKFTLLGGGEPNEQTDGVSFVLVAAPTRTLAGTVVDVEGAPIENARVAVPPNLKGLKDLPFSISSSFKPSTPEPRSNSFGQFRIESVGDARGMFLEVDAVGLVSRSIALGASSNESLAVVLQRESLARFITGQVVDTLGNPIPGAEVQFGYVNETTDIRGNFALNIPKRHDDDPLVVNREGHRVGVIEDMHELVRAGRKLGRGVDNLRVELEGNPLTISGTVVDANGEPQPDFKICLLDGTPKGGSSEWAEYRAHSGGMSSFIHADDRGRYTIPGLSDRTYRFQAWNSNSVLLLSDAVPAGTTDYVLRMPAQPYRPKVRGRVVNISGQPIEGVELSLMLWVVTGGTKTGTRGKTVAQSDSDGAFTLEQVPSHEIWISASYPETEQPSFALKPGELTALLTLSFKCRVQVEIPANSTVTRCVFRDELARIIHDLVGANVRVRRMEF